MLKTFFRLARDGVECFFDQSPLNGEETGSPLSKKPSINAGILLSYYQTALLHREWGRLEWTSAIADDPVGLQRKIRPLLLNPCDVPRFLKPLQVIDVTTQLLR